MFRFAFKTVPDWFGMWNWAKAVGDDHAPLFKLVQGDFSPMCWDSSPFVLNIYRVLNERVYNVAIDNNLKSIIRNVVLNSNKIQSDIYSFLLPMFFKLNPIV